MKVPILAILALILASLSCTQMSGIATFTPTAKAMNTATFSPTATATIPTATADADTAQVVRPIVNVRSAPEGEVIGSLSEGDVVTVLQCSGNWCEVETNVLKGYIYQGCLSISDGLGCEAK